MSSVNGMSYDFVLEFKDNSLNPKLYIEENLQDTLLALMRDYGTIQLKMNYFSKDIKLYSKHTPLNASVTSPEGLQGTETSNVVDSVDIPKIPTD